MQMETITDVSIDLYGDTQHYMASAKQGDKATRYLRIQLMDNGNEFQIPADAILIANIRKPDGKFCYNECERENNRVMVLLTNQALAVAGTAYCDIEIRDGSGDLILSSAVFSIEIEQSMRNESAIESSNEMTFLDSKFAELKTIQEKIKEMKSDVEEAKKQVDETYANYIEALNIHTNNEVVHLTADERDKIINGTYNYGTCETAADTVEKTVACTGFKLATGAEITVKFTITNTAANPTLNVNSTGAKAIYYRGNAITAGYLAANRIYTFRYNGTQYDLVGDIDTNTNNAVTQTNTTTNLDYRVLFSAKADDTTRTEGARKSADLKYNPSTKTLTTGKVNADTADSTVTFTSGDGTNPTGWADIDAITSGETHSSLWRKMSLAVKNLRYIWKTIGSTDISDIGDGTIRGAIASLNSGLGAIDGKKVHFKSITSIVESATAGQNYTLRTDVIDDISKVISLSAIVIGGYATYDYKGKIFIDSHKNIIYRCENTQTDVYVVWSMVYYE